MKEFVRYRDKNREAVVDVAIKCSGLPDMYIRVIQRPKDDEIQAPLVLISFKKDYFNIPTLRDISEKYCDESVEEW